MKKSFVVELNIYKKVSIRQISRFINLSHGQSERVESVGLIRSELDPLMQRLVDNVIGVAKGDYFLDLNYVEPIQFTHYHKLAHYGWHCDSSVDGIGATRLISATVELSDPDEHIGATLNYEWETESTV